MLHTASDISISLKYRTFASVARAFDHILPLTQVLFFVLEICACLQRALLKCVDGAGRITGVALRSTENNYRWLLIFSEARLMCGPFSRGMRLLEGLISASKDGCCTST